MELSKAVRKGNKVIVEDVELEEGIFINEINKASSQGLLLTLDNKDLYFIDNTNYFIELKDTLEAFKEFLNVFAQGGVIGQGQAPVIPDASLVQSANSINSKIDDLINKIP